MGYKSVELGVFDGFYWFSNVSPELTTARIEFKICIPRAKLFEIFEKDVKSFLDDRTGRYTGPKTDFFQLSK